MARAQQLNAGMAAPLSDSAGNEDIHLGGGLLEWVQSGFMS